MSIDKKSGAFLLLAVAVAVAAAVALWPNSAPEDASIAPVSKSPVPEVRYCDRVEDWEACWGREFAGLDRTTEFTPAAVSDATAYTRHVRWAYTVRNLEDVTAERLDLWFHAPADLPRQRLLRLSLSHAGAMARDSAGNRIVHVDLGPMAPRETKVVRVLATVGMAGGAISSERPEDFWLEPAPLAEADNPDVMKNAARLKAKTPYETARRIFHFAADEVPRGAFDPTDRGALYALKNRGGDCTEAALLFTALCRAAGVPARALTGYVVDRDRVLKTSDLHNWAQFFDQGRWRLADPYYGIFDDAYENHLATEIMTGRGTTPLGGYHNYRYDGHGLDFAVTME
ncbi:MAG: transglutaminase-like domain-containing protein [Desulfatibacillaceae bacterium]